MADGCLCCIKYFPEGIDGLVARFQPYLSDPVVQEGLHKIAEKFASMDHLGPQFIADRAAADEDRAFLRRDAYEQIHALLIRLGLANS